MTSCFQRGVEGGQPHFPGAREWLAPSERSAPFHRSGPAGRETVLDPERQTSLDEVLAMLELPARRFQAELGAGRAAEVIDLVGLPSGGLSGASTG